MNVTCPECRSVFRVDPAKLPGSSVRARCSVCGGVIVIAAGADARAEFATATAGGVATPSSDAAAPWRASIATPAAPRVSVPTPIPATPFDSPSRASTPIASAAAIEPEDKADKEPVAPAVAEAAIEVVAVQATAPVANDMASPSETEDSPPGDAPVSEDAQATPVSSMAVVSPPMPTPAAPVPVFALLPVDEALPEPARSTPARATTPVRPVTPASSQTTTSTPPPSTAIPPASVPARPASFGGMPAPFARPSSHTGTGASPGAPPPFAPRPSFMAPPTTQAPRPSGTSPGAGAGSPTPSSSPVAPRPAVSATSTTPRAPINPFLANDPNAKAKRLARALVSDIVAYFPQKREEGMRDGTLKQLFREEIKKSYEEYVDQIGREFAEGTAHFQDALNDVLAGGKKLF